MVVYVRQKFDVWYISNVCLWLLRIKMICRNPVLYHLVVVPVLCWHGHFPSFQVNVYVIKCNNKTSVWFQLLRFYQVTRLTVYTVDKPLGPLVHLPLLACCTSLSVISCISLVTSAVSLPHLTLCCGSHQVHPLLLGLFS